MTRACAWPIPGRARLPLASSAAGTVALIGPNVNLSMSIAGYYGPANACGPRRWPTMVDAVANHADGGVSYARGVPSVSSNDTSLIDEAVRVAAAAGTVVCVVGSDLSQAREGLDATSLALSRAQLELVDRVAAAAVEPVVVVLLTATPLDISPLLANPRVGAIVLAGFPSVQGEGVGDVLFGVTAPAGRLVQTIYPADFAQQVEGRRGACEGGGRRGACERGGRRGANERGAALSEM